MVDDSDELNQNPISDRPGARLIDGSSKQVEDGGRFWYDVWEWNNAYFVVSWWTEVDEYGHEYVDGDPYWQEIEIFTDAEAIAYVSDPANWQ